MFKKFLFPGNYDQKINIALLFLRVATSAFMLTHGIPKLSKLFSENPITFSDPIGLWDDISFVLVVFAEFLCTIFLVIGVATRFSVIPLIITMIVTGFVAQADSPFDAKEKAFLFLTIFIALLITGAGRFSIDNFIMRSLTSNDK